MMAQWVDIQIKGQPKNQPDTVANWKLVGFSLSVTEWCESFVAVENAYYTLLFYRHTEQMFPHFTHQIA